jgi:hypothetical protein
MTQSFFKTIKSAQFQLTCLLITMIFVISLLIVEHQSENYAEEIFPIQKVPDSVKNLASNVSVGLSINNFPTFSFQSNNFTMDAFIWFRFPVGTESIHTIEKFDFQNGDIKVQDGKIIYLSQPMIKLIEDDVIVSYQVKVDFKSYLNYKHFPLDDHRLNIILRNKSVTPHEMCFNSDLNSLVFSENILVTSWRPAKKTVQTGYMSTSLKTKAPQMETNYPCAVFTIDFENVSIRNLITLYFPMYVIFFIAIFSLMIDISEYLQRMGLIASAMPMLVLFRMVIVQLSPSTGSTTKVDFVYFLLVFLSLLILLYQAYLVIVMKRITRYNEETQKRKLSQLEKASNLIFIGIIALLILILIYNNLFM